MRSRTLKGNVMVYRRGRYAVRKKGGLYRIVVRETGNVAIDLAYQAIDEGGYHSKKFLKRRVKDMNRSF